MEKYIGEKLFIIRTASIATKFIINLYCGKLSMNVVGGHDPYIEEFYAGLFKMIGDSHYVYDRKSNFRFCHRTGMSGATDYYIEYVQDSIDYCDDDFGLLHFQSENSSCMKA